MKHVKLSVLALLAILVFAVPAGAGELKIGYADLQKALNTSEAGVNAKESLKKEADRLEKELDAEQAVLKKMKEEIDKKKNVWNKDTLRAKELDFSKQSQAFQKKYVDFNGKLNKIKREKESEIIDELKEVVKEVAKEKGYTFVFEKSTGGLLLGPPEADLTEEVIKRHNKRFRESGK
ncbi:MAG: OmpH family outer membrane protein [Thermodesulfobacteriota bacterium]|nr:MAG: OmpH family outer membrane protein [Thermodesulfobacteriota bacterium]